MTGHPYSQEVLQRFRRPVHRGTLPRPTVSQEGHNPLCGDRVRFDMRLDGDVVAEARFTANACALCVASADFLAELVQNAPLDEVETLTVDDLVRTLRSKISASRLACVTLPLTVMHIGIKQYREARSATTREPVGP